MYNIDCTEIVVIKASKTDANQKDIIEYTLRESTNGWIIYLDHFNADKGHVESKQIFLHDDIVDVLLPNHAKRKLRKTS